MKTQKVTRKRLQQQFDRIGVFGHVLPNNQLKCGDNQKNFNKQKQQQTSTESVLGICCFSIYISNLKRA